MGFVEIEGRGFFVWENVEKIQEEKSQKRYLNKLLTLLLPLLNSLRTIDCKKIEGLLEEFELNWV